METPSFLNVRSVVILKADRLHAEALRQHVINVLPNARPIIVHSLEAAQQILSNESVDLFITGVGACLDSDVLDMLAHFPSSSSWHRPRILVVTVRREYRVLATLRTLAVDGVFDSATEPTEQFANALRTIAAGKRYWSQSIVDHMHRVGSASTALFRLLTTFEQVVLSVIGDGSDNTAAARELMLSPATVSTVRRELHRKLGVQHRGELVRVAAQHGFVRFTPAGVVRPGFAIMREAYEAKRVKRTPI